MIHRAVFASLLIVAAPCVGAPQASHARALHKKAKTVQADPVKTEDAKVQQLKAKVGTLESQSDASARELAERDRKIEELRRQLAAEQHH